MSIINQIKSIKSLSLYISSCLSHSSSLASTSFIMSGEGETIADEGRGGEGSVSSAPIGIVLSVIVLLLGLILLFVISRMIISLCSALTELTYEKKKEKEILSTYKKEKMIAEKSQTFFSKKLEEGLTLKLTSVHAFIDVNMDKYKKLSKLQFRDFKSLLTHSSGLAYVLQRRAKEAQRSYKTPAADMFITDRVGVAARVYHKAGSTPGTFYTNLAFGPTYYDHRGELHLNMTDAVSFKMKDFLRFADAVS